MDKAEYIKQLKRLIKKYHPDLCKDSYLELLYSEITKKLVNKLNKLKTKENENNKVTEGVNVYNEYGIIKIKEPPTSLNRRSFQVQDYAYYKLGIKYYKNIHPNNFYKRNPDTTFETKTYDEQLSALNKIYFSFKLSEYYFNKVINEYPKSLYAEDSREKVKLLKKLHKSYENIILEENKIVNNNKFMEEMNLKIM